MKGRKLYTMDLTKIEGDGSFPCPGCKALISPDDKTDTTYQIVNTKTKGGMLEELIIQCNLCKSNIKLKGFELLSQIEKSLT